MGAGVATVACTGRAVVPVAFGAGIPMWAGEMRAIVRRPARLRFSLELALAVVSGVLCLATLINARWLEVLGFDPDHGSGAAEWALVIGTFAVAVAAALLAKREILRSTV